MKKFLALAALLSFISIGCTSSSTTGVNPQGKPKPDVNKVDRDGNHTSSPDSKTHNPGPDLSKPKTNEIKPDPEIKPNPKKVDPKTDPK